MLRILLLIAPVLAACTPAPQKAAMPSPSASSETPARGPSETDPVGARPDSPAAAEGRRILSTAFVRLGPDGHMILELRDGRVLVLNNVAMRPQDYCGVLVMGDPTGTKFCGEYAEVAAARPGGAPTPDQPDPMAPGPVGPRRDSLNEK